MNQNRHSPEQQKALDNALRLAISAKDLEMMGLAIDSGAKAQILLTEGVVARQKDWVELALFKGADPNGTRAGYLQNASKGGDHPLVFWLCEFYDAGVAAALVKGGADVNAKGPDGFTPLYHAAKNCPRDVIEWLVKSGADPLHEPMGLATPMQALNNNGQIDSNTRTLLTKMMLQEMAARKQGGTAAAPFNQVATKDTIEISKPIELKKKPEGGGGLNL